MSEWLVAATNAAGQPVAGWESQILSHEKDPVDSRHLILFGDELYQRGAKTERAKRTDGARQVWDWLNRAGNGRVPPPLVLPEETYRVQVTGKGQYIAEYEVSPLLYRSAEVYIPEGWGKNFVSESFPTGLADYELQRYNMEWAVAGRLIPSEQALHFRLTDSQLPQAVQDNPFALAAFRIAVCRSWFEVMERDDALPGVYGNRYGLFYSDGAQKWAKSTCLRRERFDNQQSRAEKHARLRRQIARNRR